jgi:hypothetical protein
VLFFNWAPRHEGVLEKWMYSSTHSLTSVLYRGEWSASRPGRFTPRERVPGTHCRGGWVGLRAVLDAVVKRKIPSKVVPVLNYAPRHKGLLGEWRYSSTHSLTSALDGGEWSASRPGPPSSAEVKEWVELYLHSPIRLHGVGITLPLPLSGRSDNKIY